MFNISTVSRATTNFDRTIAVHPRQPLAGCQGPAGSTTTFDVDFDDTWASLIGMHGGAMVALAVRAAEHVVPDRPVRTVSATFLRRGSIGAAELDVTVLRHGRGFTTLLGRIRQAGRELVELRLTLAIPAPVDPWTSAPACLADRRRPAPIAACVGFTPPPGIRHFEQARLRIDPTTIPRSDSADARIAGHVQPLEARPFDAPWLAMIGDWFPPAPFRRLVPPAGGVSIDYTVHLHRTLPADPDLWLEGVFEAADQHGGIALERGVLTTPDGAPVAETFHTRWTG